MARIKYLIFLFPFLFPINSLAQTQEGALLIYGNASFDFDNIKQKVGNVTQELGKKRTIDLNSATGYFIMDGIAVGGIMNWQREAFITVDDEKDVFREISVGPFARYYSALGPFFHSQLTFGGGVNKFVDSNGEETINNFSVVNFALGIGYPFFFGNNVSVEPLLVFRSSARSSKNAMDEKVKDKKSGLLLSIGLSYYLF